jgi:hypothetical protein
LRDDDPLATAFVGGIPLGRALPPRERELEADLKLLVSERGLRFLLVKGLGRESSRA